MKKAIITALSSMTLIALISGCNAENVTEKPTKKPAPSTEQVEKKEDGIKPYGQLVDVKGKKMNVLDTGNGEGKETIVLIPGLGDIAPGLSYTKMLEELSPHYRVVVVEPFGYGLSDVSDDPRTIENITEEIHEAVKQVGVDKYVLMGHSISGVYGMKYIDSYRDEVTAFIGLDSSFPKMLDGMMLTVPPLPDDYVPTIPEVSDEINDQYGKIFRKNNNNKNQNDEDARKKDNFEKSKKLSFPADLPVAFFLAKESIENQKLSPTDTKDFVKAHTDLTTHSKYTKVYEIDSDHLLYQTKYKEITEKLNEFLSNIPADL